MTSAMRVQSRETTAYSVSPVGIMFGTGGIRAIMGCGACQINDSTIKQTTIGLGRFLLENYGKEAARERGVVVAYDTRHNSARFARISAEALTGMGFIVYLFDDPTPTPLLSFTVPILHCLAGIVITASHNPKEYNGYKVYDENGSQALPPVTSKIAEYINRISLKEFNYGHNDALIKPVETMNLFIESILNQSLLHDDAAKAALRIVYTPLNGTGNIPVRKLLRRDGFTHVSVVPNQAYPDGDFATVHTPNPEDPDAMRLALEMGREENADIVLGTDPDCDRVGVGVRNPNGTYTLLTGNQIGALLTDYLARRKSIREMHKAAVINTIVSGNMGLAIARKHGAHTFSTLTGFKYIVERMLQFEKARASEDTMRNFTFLLGYEESNGYLINNHVRDKDAVSAVMVICEMTAEYKQNAMTLLDRLHMLETEFGYYYETQEYWPLSNGNGTQRVADIMRRLRSGELYLPGLRQIIDYNTPIAAEPGFGMLPPSDVLKFQLQGDSFLAIRPSGTESKLKIYYSIASKDLSEAESNHAIMRAQIHKLDIGANN